MIDNTYTGYRHYYCGIQQDVSLDRIHSGIKKEHDGEMNDVDKELKGVEIWKQVASQKWVLDFKSEKLTKSSTSWWFQVDSIVEWHAI